ncbi:Gfo/Idh/MocA family protein [Streptomyces collinus]|uniref:Gfo/Idh/MocA family protein n=1 Tax=Streptomyces collinus TaxID=42684 RepID=UPI0036A5CF7F
MARGRVGVAVVGCGNISNAYLSNLTTFPDLDVVFCADLDIERAKAQAAQYGVPQAGTVAQALDSPDVELIVNLTIPAAHAPVAELAIAAGKHVWIEKPLALETESGRALLAAADAANVQVGCAPDTVLGAGLQTVRRLLDAGTIGTPQTALALMQNSGPDLWHPDPEFFFRRGGGPLYDMGPYYLTALAMLFGPAESVAAVGRRSRERRVIGAGPRTGASFDVEVPTHVSALINYAGGQAATLVMSFDSPLGRDGFIEITGTEATLAAPDPNAFDGDVRVRTARDDWAITPSTGASVAGRGLGVLDMARAIRDDGRPRASGELALHVLEIMEAIIASADTGAFVPIRTTFTAPEALAEEWDPLARTLA